MFKKRKLSKNQVSTISTIHGIFAFLARSNISALLRSPVHMQVLWIKQMPYKNYIRSIPVPTTTARISMGQKGNAIFEIDYAVAFSIIDRLCGGTGKSTKVLRDLTDIETFLIEGILVRIVGNWGEAWRIKTSLGSIDTNPMFINIVNPSDMVVVVSMEIVIGDVKGRINICVPHFSAELLMDKSLDGSLIKTASVENNTPSNKEDVLANLAEELKELKHDFYEFRDGLVSKEKPAEQVQGQETDAQKTDVKESDLVGLFSSAVKDHVENVAELIRVYLLSDDRLKAAVFLTALGSELSIEIYKHLREDEIETLTFDISRLELIDCKQKTAVLNEFYNLYAANQNASIGGIDYARVLLEGAVGTKKAIDIINRLTQSLQVRPFDFIRLTDPEHLLGFIQEEHPQIIALVLAYLEPVKASIILQKLPKEMQSDVTSRIATMDRTSPEVLREVERVLEKKLSTLSSVDYCAAGGVESVVEILNLVDRSTEKHVIETLQHEDPKLAEEITQRMFVFEDIVMLDDRSIQKVLREVDSQEMAKALKSVDTEIQDKIFRNMSKKAADMLKEDMEYMGPVRLKDVEEAQQKIISIIRHLEDTGEIFIARAGEDELVI
jgi:flagellar motor switch protein FliG